MSWNTDLSTGISETITEIQSIAAAQVTDESNIATLTSDLATVIANQLVDEAAIATLTSNLATVAALQVTDEANIATLTSNLSAVTASQVTDEASIATLQSNQATDEADIAALQVAVAPFAQTSSSSLSVSSSLIQGKFVKVVAAGQSTGAVSVSLNSGLIVVSGFPYYSPAGSFLLEFTLFFDGTRLYTLKAGGSTPQIASTTASTISISLSAPGLSTVKLAVVSA